LDWDDGAARCTSYFESERIPLGDIFRSAKDVLAMPSERLASAVVDTNDCYVEVYPRFPKVSWPDHVVQDLL
jgi:hypothetical protein